MALQGVCEIELRDEQGDVVQKTKDKNMITNGFSNTINIYNEMIMELFNIESMIVNISKTTPILHKMIGGIYLFDEVQDELVDNIIPNFNKIVGSCSLSKGIIDDSRIGLWNINESDIIYNSKGKISGIKFVFDFPTDRSNGTIRSVSLTTDIASRTMLNNNFCFGFYNGNSATDANSYKNYIFNKINPVFELLYKNQSDINESYTTFSMNSRWAIVTITKNGEIVVIHSFDSASKTFVLRKYRTRNLVDLNSVINYGDLTNESIFTLLLEKTIDYSDIIIGNDTFDIHRIIGSIYYYDNYIYLTNAFNKTIKVKKISLENFDIVENISRQFEQGGLNRGADMNYSNTLKPIFIYKNYYVISQYVDNELFASILFINRNDLTIAKKISYDLYNSNHNAKGLGLPAICSYIGDYLYVRYTYSTGTSGELDICKTMYVDKELNIYEINNKYSMTFYMPINQEYFKYPFMICRKYDFSYSQSYVTDMINNSMAISPYIKFTIDNLATPVTKTASQTMKVIYTIKDAEEQ